MKISVIIPTYNRAGYLERSINSVLGQTRPADEVIIVDDASTDGTTAFINSHFPTCTYIRLQENTGVSASRNAGIAAANSDWLAFLDSDDEWHPDKLELQEQAIVQQPDYRFCHTDEIWIRNGTRVNPHKKHAKSGGFIFEKCLPLCCISPSSVMIHHSVFDELGDFDESLPACEDYDYWLRFCAKYPVLFLEKALLTKYGGHDDQLSQKHWGMDRFRIQALQTILETGELDDAQQEAARAMLVKKTDIFTAGARKRADR